MIEFTKAQEIAKKIAYRDWNQFNISGYKLFSEKVFYGKSAWMFIRNPQIHIPENHFLMKRSYVVSKRGEVRGFEEVYPDEAECQRIVDYMSDYFDEKGL